MYLIGYILIFKHFNFCFNLSSVGLNIIKDEEDYNNL